VAQLKGPEHRKHHWQEEFHSDGETTLSSPPPGMHSRRCQAPHNDTSMARWRHPSRRLAVPCNLPAALPYSDADKRATRVSGKVRKNTTCAGLCKGWSLRRRSGHAQLRLGAGSARNPLSSLVARTAVPTNYWACASMRLQATARPPSGTPPAPSHWGGGLATNRVAASRAQAFASTCRATAIVQHASKST